MKVYLIHHATAFSLEEDPKRHLTELGRGQADRLGARFADAGISPVKILHSDKQWVLETAERMAAAMGVPDRTAVAAYPIDTPDPVEPFIDEINNTDGDIMMVGHVRFLRRVASRLVCGDEGVEVLNFKPDFCTMFCLGEEDGDWTVRFGWRHEHLSG